ncbi:pilus assembly protein PilP [Rhodoferax saidenbachensis]|uniref:Pilus assembly protein PilP n=1 Tax=Rhodoferax saidenbachensis TaxID=1484693 RepID=A0A1P8KDG4_9BURK|nr:pilus assembly protein PilP [Rhodoferax saidenbachensis]APW43948.1 pilus assembly protein PilP [Rhodoferax saidenbachensis]
MRALYLLLLLSAFLSGCGSSSEDEIRQWMAEERNQTKPKVAPIPAPKQFKPEAYANASTLEPFSNQKLTQALKRDSAQVASNGALVAPELARRKEPLEAFPLDTMSLVGSIIKAGQPVALVRVDGLLYQVKLGNYLGPNYGKVTKINEAEVTLREIVQDAVGEWIERIATLQLQEKSK